MTLVKGYAALKAKTPLVPFNFSRRNPQPHDVVIEIKYCGICHSDIHQARNEWGGSTFPMVPGHEIAGIVRSVGSRAKKFKVGAKVGVGCLVDACHKCTPCKNHREQYCEDHPSFTYNSKERDGKTATQGGYSTAIVVHEDFVFRIPKVLPLAAAAPLLCAGITLYSPLKYWKAGKGKKVAIVGLGGLGHMGVKLAHAMGAEVTVLSHSAKKKKDALRLGADYFYSTSDTRTFKKLEKYFDLMINTVSAEIDWNQYLEFVKIDGSLVLVGVPEKNIPVDASALIMGHRQLAGSLIGGLKETQEMLDFCGKHKIVSDIELIPIQKVNQAYARVVKSDVRYRFVIDMDSLRKPNEQK